MLSIDYCFFSFLPYYNNIVAMYNQHTQRNETAGMKHARETGASRQAPPGMEAGWPGDGGRASRGPATLGAKVAGGRWVGGDGGR